VPLVLLAAASAVAVLDCVLVLVLPGLATETGALALAAAPWTATALPPVAVWVVLLDWVACCVWLVEPPEPPEPPVVDLAVCPASCVVPLVLLAGALAATRLDCVLVLLLPGLATEMGAFTLAATP